MRLRKKQTPKLKKDPSFGGSHISKVLPNLIDSLLKTLFTQGARSIHYNKILQKNFASIFTRLTWVLRRSAAAGLKIYKMVITLFPVNNKEIKFCFFEETFLPANISKDVISRIQFLTLSNIELNFNKNKLRWRFYTTIKAFFNTRQVKLMRKKQFAVVVLDLKDDTFMVHILSLAIFDTNEVYLSHRVEIALLKSIRSPHSCFLNN